MFIAYLGENPDRVCHQSIAALDTPSARTKICRWGRSCFGSTKALRSRNLAAWITSRVGDRRTRYVGRLALAENRGASPILAKRSSHRDEPDSNRQRCHIRAIAGAQAWRPANAFGTDSPLYILRPIKAGVWAR